MPRRLPNGTYIFNVTPHDLNFVMSDGEVVRVQSDGVVNAAPSTTDIEVTNKYTLVSVKFYPTQEGSELIENIRRKDADALIVGSVLAAQAYPGLVVTPVPYAKGSSSFDKRLRLVRSDRFTIYPQEIQNNG